MIAKIAVSAATFAIDKPYSYAVPETMALQPGMRVMVPFGRSNRRSEGVVLAVEDGSQEKLKAVDRCLDEAPVLSPHMLRLAAFMRERYFCTLYDAVRTMLPAGLWFQSKDSFALTEDRAWQDSKPRQADALKLLKLLLSLGGQADGSVLREAVPDEEAFEKAVSYLIRKKWITAQRDFSRRLGDKTEKIATLIASPEEALEYAAGRPKSAAMQRSVLELMCSVGSAAVKEICYFTGAKPATVNRLADLGYLELSERPVLRCRQIKPAAVIAVDALAAREAHRLCRSIQITDAGITPGSGVGNARRALNEASLGVRVIAIGVPTVIDARTLIADLGGGDGELPPEAGGMIVTPRDIDKNVRDVAKLIAYSLNLALHEGLSLADIDMFLS